MRVIFAILSFAAASLADSIPLTANTSVIGLLQNTPWIGAQTTGVEITDSSVTIFRRSESNSTYASFPPRPVPARVWKEVFRVRRGKLVQDTLIEASVRNQPAAEIVTWPDEK